MYDQLGKSDGWLNVDQRRNKPDQILQWIMNDLEQTARHNIEIGVNDICFKRCSNSATCWITKLKKEKTLEENKTYLCRQIDTLSVSYICHDSR